MKNKKIIIVFTIIVVVCFFIIQEMIPMTTEKESKNRIFEDMEKKKEEGIEGIIGIIPENTKDGLVSHNGLGSGVIFAKEDNTYYAVTAKHVVTDEKANYKVFTKDTAFSGKTVQADDEVSFEIPDDHYYQSLLDSKIEFISPTDDIAILSFEYDKELKVLEFETNKLSEKDKIMVIGHPEGKRYQVTYGYIQSKTKKVRGDKVVEHNAYMKQGNSGGVALTKNMKIAGINIAGSYTLLGHYKAGYMIPYEIVEENINQWKH